MHSNQLIVGFPEMASLKLQYHGMVNAGVTAKSHLTHLLHRLSTANSDGYLDPLEKGILVD